MSAMALPRFALDPDRRAVACLGAGILVYLALWAYARARRVWLTVLLAFVAGALVLGAVGFTGTGILGVALVAAGLWLALRRGGSLRPDAPVSYWGLGLAAVGVAIAVPGGTPTLLAPGAVGAALLLLVGPWLWRLALAGVDEIDVYAEVTEDAVAVFVRDRGSGFDRAAVPADRRGLVESIEGRLERAGGEARIASAPGEGTEVELHVPRRAQ